MPENNQYLNQTHRPEYHFLPPANWMNDPNGPVYWKGEYHLFYQHNPYGAYWDTMHWGHAVSRDLVHWEHLPLALTPSEDYDKDGVFSGCLVLKDSLPTIIYTGVPDLESQQEVQCIATSQDMINWEKYEGNPVLAEPPKGLDITGFRDPFVWKEGDYWYMALGSGIKELGGSVLLYRSQNLQDWEYLNPLFIGCKRQTGEMWECPNFFKLEDRYVLLISPFDRVVYWIGEFENNRFLPEKRGLMDLGSAYYAPNSFVDNKDRRLVWAWLKEQRSQQAQKEDGWSGTMSLPRELFITGEGDLGQRPVEEFKQIRDKHLKYREITVEDNKLDLLENAAIEGRRCELKARVTRITAARLVLKIKHSQTGEEFSEIICDFKHNRVALNTENSSKDRGVETGDYGGDYQFNRDSLKLHVFLDNSIIEVFIDDHLCLSGRVYPENSGHTGFDLFLQQGQVRVQSLDIWDLASVWR